VYVCQQWVVVFCVCCVWGETKGGREEHKTKAKQHNISINQSIIKVRGMMKKQVKEGEEM